MEAGQNYLSKENNLRLSFVNYCCKELIGRYQKEDTTYYYREITLPILKAFEANFLKAIAIEVITLT